MKHNVILYICMHSNFFLNFLVRQLISLNFFVVSLYGIFFTFSPCVHIVHLSRGTPLQRGGAFLSLEVWIHIDNFVVHNWIYIFVWRVASFVYLTLQGQAPPPNFSFTPHDFADFSRTPSPFLHFLCHLQLLHGNNLDIGHQWLEINISCEPFLHSRYHFFSERDGIVILVPKTRKEPNVSVYLVK